MKEVKINAYMANELPEKIKLSLLQTYHEINLSYDWSQPIIEGFNEDLDEYGITAEVFFTGFWSPGDGACFVTDTVDTDKLIRKLYEKGYDIPEDCLLYSKDLSVMIQKCASSSANRYSHENTIEAYVHNENQEFPIKPMLVLENTLTEWAREVSRELYSKLENYYIELTTDEAIMNTLMDEDNQYLFTQSGTIIPS